MLADAQDVVFMQQSRVDSFVGAGQMINLLIVRFLAVLGSIFKN